MTIEIFTSDKIDFTINERRQFDRIKKKMIDAFSKEESRHCIIVDYVIGNKQFDIIVIKNNAIISIDLKGYKGKVFGSENGVWYVETEEGKPVEISQLKNPFLQAREQRYQLLDYLNEKLPQISQRFKDQRIYRISCILCFEEGSTYNIEQLDYHAAPWFDVTDESHVLEKIDDIDSNEFILKNIEIDALIKQMNLQKIEIEKQKKKLDISDKSVLSSEDIAVIAQRITEDFDQGYFDLKDISEIVDIELAASFLEEAVKINLVEKNKESNKFYLVKNWLNKLPKIEEDEDICSKDDLRKYTKGDFWLQSKNPEFRKIYEGVYRGTKYHLDYKKNVWWRSDKSVHKIKAKFSNEEILDKILELKPQGGSFRITEAKEVLTKIFLEESGYVSIYVDKYDGEIFFDNFQWEPKDIKKGCLWASIYDGTKFSVNTNKELLIHIGDRKVYAKDGHEEIVKKVLDFIGKTGGGSFKINENGNILVLMYKAPYPEKIRKQIENLSPEEKNLIDIRNKMEKDERVPIYIGKFRGNIKFQKLFDIHEEWTREDDEAFIKRLGGLN
jgi:hypothetical protein